MKKRIIRQYTRVKDTVKDCSYYSGAYIHVDEDVKRRKYKFIKSYEHFVLLERLDNGCRECFSLGEYNQLEVIN